jgi:hypothetical protein
VGTSNVRFHHLRRTPGTRPRILAALLACASVTFGCATASDPEPRAGAGASSASSGQLGGAGGAGGSGGLFGAGGSVPEPATCEEAAELASYVGCDFNPTVTPNPVAMVFDYAVVVANGNSAPVDVTVTRGTDTVATAQVKPNTAETIYLPWVIELKQPNPYSGSQLDKSVRVADGAYHLVSSLPVTVYQFNAIEYAPVGGPPGKDWANECPPEDFWGPCFSFSNDASLLLPTTSLRNSYRLTGIPGSSVIGDLGAIQVGSYAVVTGLEDATQVEVLVSATGQVREGDVIPAAGPGEVSSFSLDRGEAAVVLGPEVGDLSGSIIQADRPIQVIHGAPCVDIPETFLACDHIEETVFPAESWGRHYLVARPLGIDGAPDPHTVRIYGNVDGTVLTYPSGAPPGAPATIDAGEVVVLDQLDEDFEVIGDQELAVASYLLGAQLLDPIEERGDPSQSMAVPVEQYRERYVFLAPTDYDLNYVMITMPLDAEVTLDGKPIGVAPTPIGNDFGVAGVPLPDLAGGSHKLEATAPVGIQVVGYGKYTSYYYPGGANFTPIAPPPK